MGCQLHAPAHLRLEKDAKAPTGSQKGSGPRNGENSHPSVRCNPVTQSAAVHHSMCYKRISRSHSLGILDGGERRH